MEKEVWKPIPGAPGYEASTLGRVRSFRTGRRGRPNLVRDSPVIIKPCTRHRGRQYVVFIKNNKRHDQTLHTVVLETFVGPRPEGMFGLHNDDNHLNNNLSNLRWGTPKENWADRKKNGIARIGTKNPAALLSADEVLAIRVLYSKLTSAQSIAAAFGVHRTVVCGIVRGKTYPEVGGPITHSGRGSRKHRFAI